MPKILITGATGHAGVFTIIEFLKKGYQIHTTIRDFNKLDHTKTMLQKTGNLTDEEVNSIKFFEAEMGEEKNWAESMVGCDYVCHIAYPFNSGIPLEELYKPGVEGTMYILKLAIESPTVKHVAYCSSIGTIFCTAEDEPDRVFNDEEYAPEDSPVLTGYMSSKIIVEKKMWALVKSDKNLKSAYPITFNSLCPCGIFGPVPVGFEKWSGLLGFFKLLFSGQAPYIIDSYANVTDVRDLAEGFVKAVEIKESYGHRFIFHDPEQFYLLDMVEQWKKSGDFPKDVTDKFPTALGGQRWIGPRRTTIEKAQKILGYKPRNSYDSLLLSAKLAYESVLAETQ